MSVRQQGMTLLEVLVALVVLALSLFSGAALQVRALQATEGALHSTQAAYLTHSQLERGQAGDAAAPGVAP